MKKPNSETPRDKSIEATLDAAPENAAKRTTRAPKSLECAKRPGLRFGQGSDSELSSQTNSLLRSRLRSAALVFCVTSAAFLIKSVVDVGAKAAHFSSVVDSGQWFSLADSGRWVLAFHITHVATLAAISGLLCHRCQLSTAKLRAAEITIFGLTGAFLACLQHIGTVFSAVQRGAPTNPADIWFALIFTYAMFIPNSWRRATPVLGAMALTPLTVLLCDIWRYPAVSRAYDVDEVVSLAMMLCVGFGTSVFGVYTIGRLRREVFEARRLGQYNLRERIGAGGMGEVYLAEHQLLKRPCAIKLIRPSKADDPLALARFEREVRATATLSHWNTVEIFDFGLADDGTFFYVMEFLPGLCLAELVERYGPLPSERVIHLLMQTCDALAEAHGIGLIHRDIKPGNIFAAQRGGVFDVAKLLDFGLAKPISGTESLSLTQEGAITGSPLFMSPEQAMGDQEADVRGDIYSLGGVAYFLLTGQPPFVGDKPMKVLIAHAREAVTPPSSLRSDVPEDLEEIVLRCLSKKPEDRYETAASLRHALSRCASAGKWTRDRASRWWRETDHGKHVDHVPSCGNQEHAAAPLG